MLRSDDELSHPADRDLLVGLGVDELDIEPVRDCQARGPGGTILAVRERIGIDTSTSSNTSTNASTPKRARNPSTIELAVGAAKMQRSLLSASLSRGGQLTEIHHHAEEVRHGDGVVTHPVDPATRAELAVDHKAGAGDQSRIGGQPLGVAVEQRRGDQVGVIGKPGEVVALHGVEVELRVRHRDTLGGPVVPMKKMAPKLRATTSGS